MLGSRSRGHTNILLLISFESGSSVSSAYAYIKYGCKRVTNRTLKILLFYIGIFLGMGYEVFSNILITSILFKIFLSYLKYLQVLLLHFHHLLFICVSESEVSNCNGKHLSGFLAEIRRSALCM